MPPWRAHRERARRDLPDRKRLRERPPLTEGTMGIVVFIAAAFVMLGVERLVHFRRTHHTARQVVPRH
jgi:hypothetical protein